MIILIDMQSIQAGSGKGGIGRYSYNLLEAILKNNQSHDIYVLLNAQLSMDNCEQLYSIMDKEKIYTFDAYANTKEKIPENHFRSQASQLTREFVVSLINPDIFLITSLIEGFFDNVVVSSGEIFPTRQTAVILYDLIPLAEKEKYQKDSMVKNHYMDKLSQLSNCGLLLSISQFSKDEAIQLLKIPENNITNISSGVDKKFKSVQVSNKTKELLYKRYNIKNKFLMYTSSFDIRKNQKNLILAFALLDDELRQDYQLILVGNGSDKALQNIKHIVKNAGLKENEVICLGYINDEDLLNLYNLASLFVFPTFREGFGLPALEAMNCAVPTIGSNTTSVTEVINNKDAFFDPADIDSIKNKIQQVLLDEKFSNKLKTTGLVQAKNFSWDISAVKALEAIEKKYKSLNTNPNKKYTNQYYSFINKISKLPDIKQVSNQELALLANFIDKNIKKYNKKIGIISTWNTRCGIASYAKYLSQSFINKSIILAPKVNEKDLTEKDEYNVIRLWTLGNDNLKELLEYILSVKLEIIFIQFNYGFFNFKKLELFISKLMSCGVKVNITFHATVDSVKNKNKQLKVIKSLHKCTNIFIHTKQDIVNLNKIGIEKNISLLNQGIIDIAPQDETDITKKSFTLATYGFFLDTKGFINMIEAFKILKDQGYDVTLLMLNAEYSQAASGVLIQQAKDLIQKYELKNYIDLNTNYLNDDEVISKLSKTDLVVYPYEKTGESSSAAVRMAIASQTNIAVTPQPIFDEVKDFSFVFDGDTIDDLVAGIKKAILDIKENKPSLKEMIKKREKFRTNNLYSNLSQQLQNILFSTKSKKKLNIQIEGTYENQYSLSMVNKSIALALQKCEDVEVKIDATDYHAKYMAEVQNIDENIKPLVAKKLENIDVSIRNIYPPYTNDMEGYLKIIGPYGWEESKFPQQYVNWFNTKLTMVFTMSSYVKNILLDNGVDVPIVTTGIVVEDIVYTKAVPFDFELPSAFKLLHISSCFPRKGLDILLDAFNSLDELEDISLIIKTFPNPHNNVLEQLNELQFKIVTTYEKDTSLYIKNNKKILLINKDIPRSSIKYLYESSDILVAPSFGEGFGLPMAEAMLCELPVVTTGYGGQCDFCTNETSWLIDFDIKEAKTHLNLKNSLWAVPKISSLKKEIIDIYKGIKIHSDPLIDIKTKKAKQTILDNYSSKKIAQNIKEAISRAQSKIKSKVVSLKSQD